MPVPYAPWVAPALGNAVGHGLYRASHRLVRAIDSRYPLAGPSGPWHPATEGAEAPEKISVASRKKMARSRTTTMTARKRRRFGRRRGRRPMRRLTNLWPKTHLVKFKVVTNFSQAVLEANSLTASIYTFKANSLNDPFGSASQNLPLGLDQWAAMYKKYAVVASTFYCKVHNVTSTGSVTFGVALRRPDESDTLANAGYYQELPMTRSKILSPDMDHAALGISYKAKKYWSVRKFHDAESLHGAFGLSPGDPSRLAYYQFYSQDTASGADYTLEGWFTIEYVCLLFDPVTPARSGL